MIEDVLFYIFQKMFKKEVKIMAVIYATLIVKDKKTIDQVKEILIDLEVPELAVE